MAIEIELTVRCTRRSHLIRVQIEDWNHWEVVSSECMEAMGRAFGRMAPCYHNTKEPDEALRRQAVKRLEEARAVPVLLQALKDGDWRVRSAACLALVKIGAPAVPALIQALQDGDNRVRFAACWALGQIDDPDTVPHLIQALQDEDNRVRFAACWALGQIDGTDAVPVLTQALRDEDRYVCEVARKALERIQSAER